MLRDVALKMPVRSEGGERGAMRAPVSCCRCAFSAPRSMQQMKAHREKR